MKKRKLGKDGPMVPVMGLGCLGMTEFYGRADERESIATIHRAIDLGLNFLDTADIYGPFKNEELVGRAIRGRRDEVVLATKFGIVRRDEPYFRGANGRPEYVRSSCEGSLRRLGIETIDLYYQHRLDPETPVQETVGAMAELVGEGKVRYLGLSEVGPRTLARARRVHPITALETEYSLWTRDVESGVLAACRELGIGFVAYCPLGRGFLTGGVTDLRALERDDWRVTWPRFSPENFEKNLKLLSEIKRVAAELGCTPAQLALAWLLAKDDNVVPLFGAKRRSHLEENIRAQDIELSGEDMRRLDEAAPPGTAAGERYGAEMMRLIAD